MITLRVQNELCEPNSTLDGTVSWTFPEDVDSVEVRLIWYTEGKGTQDVTIFGTHRCAARRGGEEKFSFLLPGFPVSFSGKLVSLRWAVEAVAKPSGDNTRVEIVCAPGGIPVQLPPTPLNTLKSRAMFRVGDTGNRGSA